MTKIKKKATEEKEKTPVASTTPKPSGKVKKRIYKKHVKKNTTKVALPNRPELVSANWKALMTTITDKSKDPKAFKHRRREQEKKNSFVKKNKEPSNGLDQTSKESKPKCEIWFDDVDEQLLDIEDRPGLINLSDGASEKSLVKEHSFKGLTRVIGIDCEMVGVGYGGKDSVLARISIVNHFGNCVYDKFVKPQEKVTDYRTHVSGIRPKDILNGENFKTVQKEVSDIIKGRILVGHALKNDLRVLYLDHPRKDIRDTSTYKFFRNGFGGKTPSLKNLAERMLGVKIQGGEHSSVQDAQAAVRLYTMYRKDWEKEILSKSQRKQAKNPIATHVKNPTQAHVKNPAPGQDERKIKTKTILKAPKTSDVPKVKLNVRRYYSDSD